MKTRTARLATAALAAGVSLAALAPGAGADSTTQTVTATVGDSIVTSVSNSAVNFGTLGVGAHVIPKATAGTLRVQSNVAYKVTVLGAKAALTEYVSGVYTDSVKLAPLAMTTSSVSTGAVPVTSAVIGNDATLPTLVASGTGLASYDHTFDLSFAQTVALTDKKTTYRNDLTYTTTAAL